MINNFFSSEEESFNTLLNDKEAFSNYQTKIGKDFNSNKTPSTPFIFTISDSNHSKESYFKYKNNELSDVNSLKNNNKINIDEEERAIDKFENNIQNNYFINFMIKNPKDIFIIKKETKLGRIKKNSLKKGKHDKFKRDNVIRRFKVQLVQNLYNYINICFNCNYNHKDQKRLNIIKRISSHETKSISREDNIKWFNSKIKNIFSQRITSKFVVFDSNYNKNIIKMIYEKNEEKMVIKIFEKTVREMWLIYINDDKDNSYPGFNTIKSDINKFKELGESEEYIQVYIDICKNFENIFNRIKSRKKIKKKIY